MSTTRYNEMVVMKFGGTSVGSPERIRHVGQLIQTPKPKIVVLSAMSGVTNRLVEISRLFAINNKVGALKEVETLESIYRKAIGELYEKPEVVQCVGAFVQERMDFIRQFQDERFTDFEEKQVLAQGEIISVQMMLEHLWEMGVEATYLPALEYMRTDKYSEPETKRIKSNLLSILDCYPASELFITEGYICRNAYNEIDNLKRGGSDYTASLVGAAIDAEEVQIWTDIDGLHNNDPRIVEQTTPVRKLHFDEAAELAYFGAKILHPTCIHPAKMANIPVRLLNTMEPDAKGTFISNQMDEGMIKAVAAKDGVTAIRILSTRMLMSYGFFSKVFAVFERYQTPVDMVTTSEVAVSVTIDNTNRLEEILSELRKIGTIHVDNDMSIICIAGDLNWKNIGFESAILEALEEIPVRMISYGGSNYNVSLLIRSEDKNEALQKLSNHLFYAD